MKKKIGANIARYRKENNMTQEELAEKLHISYQAVSKWENGKTLPDIALLSRIADIMKISVDALIGYHHNYDDGGYYDRQYQKDGYFWGTRPSALCLKLLELMPPTKPLKLIDIGCGEGKDAVFMARCGYTVSAFDISDTGVEKTRRLAEAAGVFVDAFKGNINDFRLEQTYDIIYSSGVFHYMKPELRGEIIDNYKKYTAVRGVNAFHIFVDKPFIPAPPDHEEGASRQMWTSGEILSAYHDWLTEDFKEVVFDCNSSGIPHKHAANIIFSRKMPPV